MYSNYVIRHNGKAYLPDGLIEPGLSTTLDCGHPRPEVKPDAFALPWGYVHAGDNPRAEYCLDCCAALELEAIKQCPAYTAYYNLDKGVITTWTGQVLMRIVDYTRYRHNLGGRFVAITARDNDGQYWHGRASYDNGEIINLYRNKAH